MLTSSILGQKETAEEIKAKHDAYFQCINNIEPKPREAFEYCGGYIKRYPYDDPRLIEFASLFLTAFPKIDAYLRTIPTTDFIEFPKWSIYKPDLQKAIPWMNDVDSKYKISISREFASPTEEKFLAKAEAVYGPRKDVDKELFKGWRYLAQDQVELPSGEPKWWAGSDDTILSAQLVTASAVLYYYGLSQSFRTSNGIIKPDSFKFLSSELKYTAVIKLLPVYARSGKSFKDAYVANMTLTWGQICGGLCGAGFTRNKIVVIDKKGEILEVFLDDPTNSSSWVS